MFHGNVGIWKALSEVLSAGCSTPESEIIVIEVFLAHSYNADSIPAPFLSLFSFCVLVSRNDAEVETYRNRRAHLEER